MTDDDNDWGQWGCFTAFRIGRDELAALGALTVASQELEFFVGTSIASLLNAFADSDALTADVPFKTKIQILGALVLRRVAGDATKTDRWKFLEKRLNDAREDRNHFVHSIWTHDEWTDGERTYIDELKAVKMRARKEPSVRPADKETLYGMARKAEKLADELAGFIFELWPGPSP